MCPASTTTSCCARASCQSTVRPISAPGSKRRDSRQVKRFADYPGLFANGDMTVSEIDEFCVPTPDARQILHGAVRKLNLSARAYHRILKLSLTCADLEASNQIQVQHVAEAITFREAKYDEL